MEANHVRLVYGYDSSLGWTRSRVQFPERTLCYRLFWISPLGRTHVTWHSDSVRLPRPRRLIYGVCHALPRATGRLKIFVLVRAVVCGGVARCCTAASRWFLNLRGPRVAQKLRLEALCLNLINLFKIFLSLGGQHRVPVRSPQTLVYGRSRGHNPPKMGSSLYL